MVYCRKPQHLLQALQHSHGLVTARINGQLVGLANAISDGSLGMYFPHLLVGLDWQRQGIGRRIMQSMLQYYSGFHQQILVADQQTIGILSGFRLHTCGTNGSYVDLSRYRS
ncbi:GNAT family N-acetyltransferase [Acinetobacter pseudolwoffii]|uniref:GNAT family N-acetyltransferase n=2 Tax=Acinetobacter TaxID=469 RepID=UPI001D1720CA|nr:GNAT family N-acetyltransferase [Acinetobacter pseudolwoffii]